ncbi:hypothetical protein AGMMS49983_02120 [Clostridia bacterium]|nr:hypothetical protein AGMMS49983_02120 [Clostridia bacterium]
MMTIDEVQEVLDDLAEELPEAFFKELNGGILLLPDTKESEYSRRGDLYTLGMYHRGGGMGNYIEIFYGSFERLFSHLSDEDLIKQLRKTLRHEFRHHLEHLAGEDSLEVEDEHFIQNYLQNRIPVRARKTGILPRLTGKDRK